MNYGMPLPERLEHLHGDSTCIRCWVDTLLRSRDEWKARAELAEALAKEVEQVYYERGTKDAQEWKARAEKAEALLQAKIVDAAIVAEGRKLQEAEASVARMRATLETIHVDDFCPECRNRSGPCPSFDTGSGVKLLDWCKQALEWLPLAHESYCCGRNSCPVDDVLAEAKRLGIQPRNTDAV